MAEDALVPGEVCPVGSPSWFAALPGSGGGGSLLCHAPPSPDVPSTEDLGVRHRLWVYSGRRGVHCWVCDDEVRRWSPALRAAAVEYLTLVKVGVWGSWAPPPPPLPKLTAAVSLGRSRDGEEGEPL